MNRISSGGIEYYCIVHSIDICLFFDNRDLAIELLKIVGGCEDELWMLCARSSGTDEVIDQIHERVILRTYALQLYITTTLHF